MKSMPHKQNDTQNEVENESIQRQLSSVLSELNKMVDNYVEKESAFYDKFQTYEQKYRDSWISKLLKHYVTAYENKIGSQKKYRKALFGISCALLILFSVAVIIIGVFIVCNKSNVEVNNLISLITVCITYLASLIGLIQIITKFCFPENDEQYITQIVESIQKNDLDNKKENMHLRQGSDKDSPESEDKTATNK